MSRWLGPAILAIPAAVFTAPEARAAEPVIHGVSEGPAAGGSGRVLVV